MAPDPLSRGRRLRSDWSASTKESISRRPIFLHRHALAYAFHKEALPLKGQSITLKQSHRSNEVSPNITVPDVAWQFHEALASARIKRSRIELAVNLQLISFTAATVCLAVAYGYLFAGSSYPEVGNKLQVAMFVSTILLPTYVAHLTKKQHAIKKRGNPFQALELKVESNIFKFRALGCDSKYGEDPADKLLSDLSAIFADVQDALLREISTPLRSSSFDRCSSLPLIEETETNSTINEDRHLPVFELLPRMERPSVPLMTSEFPTEESPILPEASHTPKKVDDKVSSLTLEEYIRFRLDPCIDKKKSTIEALSRLTWSAEGTAKGLTLAASGTALLSLQWAIPIILAVATALHSLSDLDIIGGHLARERDSLQKLELLSQKNASRSLVEETENTLSRQSVA